jgi:hypothetical protein
MSVSQKMQEDQVKRPEHAILETPDLAYDTHGSKDLVEDEVFDDEELSRFYAPPANYENAHRFDPSERWTYREERAVLRKVDLRILLWVLVSRNYMTYICI